MAPSGGSRRARHARKLGEPPALPEAALRLVLTAGGAAEDALPGCPVPLEELGELAAGPERGGGSRWALQMDCWSRLADVVRWFASGPLAADAAAVLSFPPSLPKECRADVHTLASKKLGRVCQAVSQGLGDERHVAVVARGARAPARRVSPTQADHALALWFLYKQQRRQQQQQQQQQQQAGSGEQPHEGDPPGGGGEGGAPPARRLYSRDEVAQMLTEGKLTDELAALWSGPAGEAQRQVRLLCLAAAAGEAGEVQAIVAAHPGLLPTGERDLSSGGQLPLHLAAAGGHVDALRLLLEAGANVGARNGDGETALQVAQRCEQCDCEAVLAQAGAIDERVDGWEGLAARGAAAEQAVHAGSVAE